jgi:CHAT domain-containing protein
MSFAFHAALLLLALSLNLVNSAPAQSQSSSPASKAPPLIPGSPQSSDEAAIRAAAEKYGSAIAAGDLETMRQLWNPQSPNLSSRLRLYQGLFSNSRLEFISLTVTRVEVTGEKAVSHLTTDERQVDKKTGAVLTERDLFHGACRSLEWVKTGDGWKIERESLLQEELAAKLDAAPSEDERRELLEKEKTLVTDVLVLALIQAGDRYRVRGDSDAALRLYRLAQTVAEKIGDEVGAAKSQLSLGLTKVVESDYEQALPLEQQALTLYQSAGNRLGAALALLHLSHVHHWLGDYRKAFECARESLGSFEEIKHRQGTAQALSEIAHVYHFQSNFQQELAYNEKAMAIYQEIGDKLQIAILRYEIVESHRGLGNYDRALEIYQDLLKQTEGSGDRIGAALIRESIGAIYAKQGRYADALDYYRQSLQVSEAQNFRQAIVAVLVPIAQIYMAEGKYAEAAPLAERAAAMARQMVEETSLYEALTSVGYCQLGLNHPEEARRAFEEAISIIEKLRSQAVGGVEDHQRYFEQRLGAYHGMLSLLARENKAREALAFAERAKARVLLDVLEQGRVGVQKAMTAEDREQERRLESEMTVLNTRLIRVMQSSKPDAQRAGEIKSRLEKARLDYEAFQTSLYVAHPELKTYRGEAPVIKADELAALLPDASSALLEYVVTDDRTYLFAATKATGKVEAEIRLYTLSIKQDELARRIEAFRRQLAERDLGFRASAANLYELLLKPAEEQLKGKTNLVIAPDGRIWDLPLQALLADDNRYVLEKGAVSYAPSLTVLREMAKARGRGAETARVSLLAFGNPAIGQTTIEPPALALRGGKLEPLPEAEEEVHALGRLYGATRSKVYVGAEAREDRVKAEAGEARILHFATHGTLNNASPMYSYLALAQGDKNEDGLLEAWELMQMDLHADLAVLSACETARGRFGAGEGVIGLTWALFVAGVPSTVVSQWKVESASTRDLMLNFHRQLRAPAASKANVTKAEALRQAALKVMKNSGTSHPFYWAGFVLVGDGR